MSELDIPCQCELCMLSKRYMGRRAHEIWEGRSGLSPVKEAAYRANWKRLSTVTAAKPKVKQPPCLHLGPELRREQCNTCKGKTLVKVFACDTFHLETQCQSKKLKGVQSCCGCQEYQPQGTSE